MKLKAVLAALFAAGFAASFAVAAGRAPADTTTGATTTAATTTSGKGDDKKADKPKCKKVELQGSDASGSVAFTVSKASKAGSALKGKTATLTVPAGSRVQATACLDAAGTLTLAHLELKAAKS